MLDGMLKEHPEAIWFLFLTVIIIAYFSEPTGKGRKPRGSTNRQL